MKSAKSNLAPSTWKKSVALGKKKFTDEAFPTSDAIYWADYTYEAGTRIAAQAPKTSWRRASDKYLDYTLWGPNGVVPNDMA